MVVPAKCTGRCLLCGVSKSPDDPFQLGVDCCLKDWEVYVAFTHLGTFDDFVQIKSNDEQIAKQTQQARQLLICDMACHRGARGGRGRSEGLNANDGAVQRPRSRNGQGALQRSSACSC